MKFVSRLCVRAREPLVAAHRGQTLTEYILVVVCVAIVLITGYQAIGHTVSSTVTGITSTVASA